MLEKISNAALKEGIINMVCVWFVWEVFLFSALNIVQIFLEKSNM